MTSSQSVPLDLQPGEGPRIQLGAEGTHVLGKVVATGRNDAQLTKNWSLSYLIRRDSGIQSPPGFHNPGFNTADPVQASWFLDENCYEWLSTRDHYFVKLSPEGDIRVSGVPIGEYDLVLRLYEQPGGCLVETIGERVKATVERESAKPIAFVGLNIDKDLDHAGELSAKNGWAWAQNYLGDKSDMAKQLAISTVPTYYLIGPDGRLAATTTDWSEMEKAIGELEP